MDRTLDLWDGKAIESSELSKCFLFVFFVFGNLEDVKTEGVLMMETWFMKFQREANTFCQGHLCDILG